MKMGMKPADAVTAALEKINTYYPTYTGAMVAVTTAGEYGAAYKRFNGFSYTVFNPTLGNSTVIDIK